MADYLAEHGNDLIPVKLIDLLSAVARMEQVQDEGFEAESVVHERIFTCDLPRLRGYLPVEALAELEEDQPMDVWIVLIEDRHADVEPLPFSSEEKAFAVARSSVPDDAQEEQLTTGMRNDGWVLYLPYGSEGDCVRVVKRTMDREP